MYDVLILYMYYAGRKRYVDIFTSKYVLFNKTCDKPKQAKLCKDYYKDETIYKPRLQKRYHSSTDL